MPSLRFFPFLYLSVTLLISCNNREAEATGAEGDELFRDFTLIGREESPDMTLKMQFHRGGSGGNLIRFEDPGAVLFDGEPVAADSTRPGAGSASPLGAYYEVYRPAAEMTGQHLISLRPAGDVDLTDTLNFTGFALGADFRDSIGGEDLVIPLSGVSEGEALKLILTDTAAFSPGLERIDTVRNGVIRVPLEKLRVLKPGPVSLELYREQIRPLRSGKDHRTSGRLYMAYSLRRQVRMR